MTLVSRLALAAALAIPAVSMTVATSPAAAQEEEAYKPSYSKDAQKALAAAQKAQGEGDFVTMAAQARQAAQVAETADDSFVAGQLLLQVGQQTGDEAAEKEGLELMGRSGSPLLKPTLQEQIFGNLAQRARDAGDTQAAVALYQELLQAQPGNVNGTVGLAEAMVANGQTADGVAMISQAIDAQEAAGAEVPETWYRRAFVLAFNNNLSAQTLPLGMKLVRAYPTESNWRDVLLTYRDANDFGDETQLDIFRLLYAVNALQSEGDYYEYASTAERERYLGEADMVLKAGVDAGALDMNKPYVKELDGLIRPRYESDRAELADLAAEAANESDGKLAMDTATTYLGYGDYAKAAELYRLALEKGGINSAEANTRLGIALARSGDAVGARAAFEAAEGGPTGTLADFWLAYLDGQG